MNRLRTIRGKSGESLANDFLLKRDHNIIERNFRKKAGEIDIISSKGETIYFIEVKFWISGYSNPIETFSKKKISKMQKVAEIYLANNRSFKNHFVSFALISISKNLEIEFYDHLF